MFEVDLNGTQFSQSNFERLAVRSTDMARAKASSGSAATAIRFLAFLAAVRFGGRLVVVEGVVVDGEDTIYLKRIFFSIILLKQDWIYVIYNIW